MKNLKFTVFVYFIFTSAVFAQVDWAPAGATWNYGILNNYHPGFEAWVQIKSEDTTTVLGTACMEMSRTIKYFDGVESAEIWYTYEANDTIYYYRPDKFDQFEIFYDFSAEVGDTVSYFVPFLDSLNTGIVDSISIVDVDGTALREWHLIGEEQFNYGSYIEGIGSRREMFPIGNITTDGFDYIFLRCYQDGNLSYELVDDCEYWGPITNVNELEEQPFSIFPNPAQDFVALSYAKNLGALTYDLFNEMGQLLKSGSIWNRSERISVAELPNGNYWIKIKSDRGAVEVIPLVVLRP